MKDNKKEIQTLLNSLNNPVGYIPLYFTLFDIPEPQMDDYSNDIYLAVARFSTEKLAHVLNAFNPKRDNRLAMELAIMQQMLFVGYNLGKSEFVIPRKETMN